jgi:hypothetical protein
MTDLRNRVALYVPSSLEDSGFILDYVESEFSRLFGGCTTIAGRGC